MPPTDGPPSSSPSPEKPPASGPAVPSPRTTEPLTDVGGQNLLNVLVDTIRAAEGRWATAVAAITALCGFGTGVWTLLQRSPEIALGALALLLLSVGLLLFQGFRRQRLGAAPQVGWFVGLRPLREGEITEGRMLRLQKREGTLDDQEDKDPLDRVIEKLRLPGESRGLLLSGEGGCGKTTVLTAARMQLKETYLCLTIQGGVQLTARLREMLRSELRKLGDNLPSDVDIAGMVLTLQSRLQRPVLLILDQFEEIFTTWPQIALPGSGDRDERQRAWRVFSEELKSLRTFLLAILSNSDGQSNTPNRLVLCVQRQFAGETEDFLIEGQHLASPRAKETVGEGAHQSLNIDRMRMESPRIEQVYRMLRQVEKPPWSLELIDRVLSEMAGGSLTHAHQVPASLAELQLIGQMLQTLRIYEPRRYPGRPRLLQEYVARLIRASSEIPPNDMRELLVALLPGPNDRAQPALSLVHLAQRVGAPAHTVQEALEELREKYALLVRYTDHREDGSSSEFHRLLPSYSAALLRDAIGHRAEVEQRTDQLVTAALAQQRARKGYVLPPSDLWWLWRHPPIERRPEYEVVFRRSLAWFLGIWMGLSSLLLTGILLVRFGLYRMDLNANRHIVLKRGLPYLMPILGSDDVLVATGFDVKDWMDQDIFPSGRELIADARNHRIFWQFLSLISPRFDAHRSLSQRARRMAFEYADFIKSTPNYVGSREVDPLLLRWRLAIDTEPKLRTTACDEYISLINAAYKSLRKVCDAPDGAGSMACDQADTRFRTFSSAVTSELRAGDRKELSCKAYDFIENLQQRFLNIEIDPPFKSSTYKDWSTLASVLDTREQKASLLLQRVASILSKKDVWADLTVEDAHDIVNFLSRVRNLTTTVASDRFTIPDAAQLLREKIKEPHLEKLQKLLLFIYAGGGPLRLASTGSLQVRSPISIDGQIIDPVLVLLGPRNPKLLALLEKQILAPKSPSSEYQRIAPSSPTPAATSATGTMLAAAPPTASTSAELETAPKSLKPATNMKSAVPTEPTQSTPTLVITPSAPLPDNISVKPAAAKQSDQENQLDETIRKAGEKFDLKNTVRAVRILFELQRYYTGDEKPIDSETIMKGLMRLVDAASRTPDEVDVKPGAVLVTSIEPLLQALETTICARGVDSESWIKTRQDYFFRRDLLKVAERFYQTIINNPSTKAEEIQHNLDRMRQLIRALLRASIPMSVLLDRFSISSYIPVERTDSELLLLDILDSGWAEHEGHIRYEGQPWGVQSRIRPLVSRYLEKDDKDSSNWATQALYYGVTDAGFEEKFNGLLSAPGDGLGRAYALHRLLRHTEGISQFEGEAAHQLTDRREDYAISDETPLAASERLFAELYSRRATRYAAYRGAVTEALVLLIQSPRSAEFRASLMQKVQQNLSSDALPFHLRMALWRLRQAMDD